MQGPQWKHLEEAGSEDLSHTATPPGSTYTADTNTVVDSADFAVAMAKLSDDLKGANSLTHLRWHQPAQWNSQAGAQARPTVQHSRPWQVSGGLHAAGVGMQQAASVCHHPSASGSLRQHTKLPPPAPQPGTWQASRELQASVLGVVLVCNKCRRSQCRQRRPCLSLWHLSHLQGSLTTLMHLSTALLLHLCLCIPVLRPTACWAAEYSMSAAHA